MEVGRPVWDLRGRDGRLKGVKTLCTQRHDTSRGGCKGSFGLRVPSPGPVGEALLHQRHIGIRHGDLVCVLDAGQRNVMKYPHAGIVREALPLLRSTGR